MIEDNNVAALLILEDGQRFWGRGAGASGESFGELVFNTGMTGYQEVLTDPSYRGQIVVMTYPEIGIYGVNAEDVESGQVQVAGFIVHRAVRTPFNHQADRSFTDYLAQAGIVAIEGVDTRALTRHLRTHGAMRGALWSGPASEAPDPEALLARVLQRPLMGGLNLAAEVSPLSSLLLPPSGTCPERSRRGGREGGEVHVVVIDAGRKGGIVRDLERLGVTVSVVPYDANAATVLAQNPDGVLVSNGPGDPDPLKATIRTIQNLIKARVPLAGICLGHQLLGLAAGGRTYKMRFGHRGANHPIKDMRTGQIVITTQNHGFAVDPTSLGIGWAPLDAAFEPARPELLTLSSEDQAAMRAAARPATMAEQLPKEPLVGMSPSGLGPIEVTYLSLNDGTVEGLRLRDYPAFSVQFHPEASPGPHDAKGFFSLFLAMVEANRPRSKHA